MENPPSSLQASLQDKVVLVTGAAKRIGRGIALRLAREGARVAIHYWTSEAEARATAAECGGAPLYRANLESVAEIERMFGEVEHTLTDNALIPLKERVVARKSAPRVGLGSKTPRRPRHDAPAVPGRRS